MINNLPSSEPPDNSINVPACQTNMNGIIWNLTKKAEDAKNEIKNGKKALGRRL